jgi:hypothetical protein
MILCRGIVIGSRPFKFKNIWLKAESIVDMVKQWCNYLPKKKKKKWWDSYKLFSTPYFFYFFLIRFSTPYFVLANKLKWLKLNFKRWNKEAFGHVEERKKSLLEEVQVLDYLEEESQEG